MLRESVSPVCGIFLRDTGWMNNHRRLNDSFFKLTTNLPLSLKWQPIFLFLRIYRKSAYFLKCTNYVSTMSSPLFCSCWSVDRSQCHFVNYLCTMGSPTNITINPCELKAMHSKSSREVHQTKNILWPHRKGVVLIGIGWSRSPNSIRTIKSTDTISCLFLEVCLTFHLNIIRNSI